MSAEFTLAEVNLFTAEVRERDSRVTVIAAENGEEFRAHLRNTGRLEGLVYPGAPVACERKETGKTDARVIGAIDEGSYVLLDTYLQEKGFEKILRSGTLGWFPEELSSIESQATFEDRRFDFGFRTKKRNGYIELKSAVTCRDGRASYPDAPSDRGLEHVNRLKELAAAGLPVYIVFVVTHPGCNMFTPDDAIQPAMGEALLAAERTGVNVYGIKMALTENGKILLVDKDILVKLDD
ncbi:DNA/RNA nuclease SfsA [Candidatus Bipolaricaulota bacterium]|nr:DNA/RNA nuclease SfsA [Candidatus Bipolaricaulota bacterium]